MEFNDLIRTRYSCRSFSNKVVEEEKVKKVIEAGILAPTARNFQPQKIKILKSKEDLEKLSECTKFGWNAPVCLVICYDKDVSYKRGIDNKEFGDIDSSIITTYMMLEIVNLGLGTTWIGHFDSEKVKEVYNLPENYVPVAILPIGYPADDAKPSERHFERKKLDEILF